MLRNEDSEILDVKPDLPIPFSSYASWQGNESSELVDIKPELPTPLSLGTDLFTRSNLSGESPELASTSCRGENATFMNKELQFPNSLQHYYTHSTPLPNQNGGLA